MRPSIPERCVLLFGALILILGIFLSRFNRGFFESWYVVEDGIVEWITVVFLVSGSLICFRRFLKHKNTKPWLFLLGTLGLSFLFFFGAGEEISWGQRLFGIKSPEFFVRNNSQMETNLHNLIFAGKKINKIVFGLLLGIAIGLYLLVLPILHNKITFVKTWVSKVALPLPQIYQIAAYVGLAILIQFVDSGKKGELLEFGGCMLFFLIVWRPSNRQDLGF